MSATDELALAAEIARLRGALRALEPPAGNDEAARAMFRARSALADASRPAARRASGRFLAAAALLAAVAAGVAWVAVDRGEKPLPAVAATASHPVPPAALAFQPLVNSPGFSATGAYSVVRVRIPMASFALVPGSERQGTIEADLLVGEDGLARGIRFARADAVLVSAETVVEGLR